MKEKETPCRKSRRKKERSQSARLVSVELLWSVTVTKRIFWRDRDTAAAALIVMAVLALSAHTDSGRKMAGDTGSRHQRDNGTECSLSETEERNALPLFTYGKMSEGRQSGKA